MSASLQAAQIIKCTFAGISCLASAFIMLMILTEPETGLASPYSRIIFALSISDILFSLGYLLSPFMSPKDNPDALFAIGTTKSCEAIGFLFIFGMHCLITYTVFLTYYFLKRIRYKVTPQDFTKKEEKYFHIFFILASLCMAFSTLATGSINPQAYGSVCGIGSYPKGCENDEMVECERGGKRVNKMLRMYSASFGIALFTTLIAILALSIQHVFKVERSLTIPARGIGNVERNTSNNRQQRRQDVEQHLDDLSPNDARQNDLHQNEVNMVLTKQALHQSLFYIAAFFLVYLAPIMAVFQRISGKEGPDELRFWISALFTPLGGVFNILIYTRPKVLKMREKYPNTPTLNIFCVIVITGGDIPSMADVRPKIVPTSEQLRNDERNQHHEEDVDSVSSVINDSGIIALYDIDISRASDFLSRDLSIDSSIIF